MIKLPRGYALARRTMDKRSRPTQEVGHRTTSCIVDYGALFGFEIPPHTFSLPPSIRTADQAFSKAFLAEHWLNYTLSCQRSMPSQYSIYSVTGAEPPKYLAGVGSYTLGSISIANAVPGRTCYHWVHSHNFPPFVEINVKTDRVF